MNWLLGMIYFVGMYPVLFVLYFVLRNAGMAKDGFCFAVRVKKEWLEESAVKEIQETYKRKLKRVTVVLAIIPLTTIGMPTFSVPFTIWMLWLEAVCIVTSFPLIWANRQMKQWKRENHLLPEKSNEVYSEMKGAGNVRRVRLRSFILPIILSTVTAILGIYYFCRDGFGAYAAMIMTFALVTLVCYGIAVWMDRQKTQVISENSDINLNYARAKKNQWKNLWMFMAWLNTVYTVVVFVTFLVDWYALECLLWGSVVYGTAMIGVLLLFVKKGNEIEAHYEPMRTDGFCDDDDDAWIGGVIYYNKKDKRTLVTKRIGIGTTTNAATWIGKILDGIAIVAIGIFIPVCCIWVILEEFTPMQIAIEDHVLVAEQLKVNYEIPLDTIESVALMDEAPRWKKVNGSATEHLYKGTYRLPDGARCQLFLNPQNELFIQIQTEEQTYYVSASDDAGTKQLFATVKADMENESAEK